MKKIIIPILLILTIIFINKTYSATTYSGGDVNKDGSINKTDAKLIAQYIISKSKPSNYTAEINVGDVNGDGKVKMNDAILVATGKVDDTTGIKLNKDAVGKQIGETITLTATTTPSGKAVTWKSSNTVVATVNSSGKVTAKKEGVATITATTNNNLTASASIIVFKHPTIDSYESSTLKYYIERPTDYGTAIVYPGAIEGSYNEQRYILTRIWVKDAYNQMKTVLARSYGTNVSKPIPLITNEINNKNYASKGLVAVNASGFITSTGDFATVININDGVEVHNAIENPTKNQVVMGLTNKNLLKSYTFSTTDIEKNRTLYNTLKSDGVRYTFNFSSPILIKKVNGVMTVSNTNTAQDPRTGLCQIDEHNFILFSSTTTPKQNDYGQNVHDQNGNWYREKHTTSRNTMGAIWVNYGCIWGANLDGGGSSTHIFKKGNSTSLYRFYDPKDAMGNNITGTNTLIPAVTNEYGTERSILDMLYFVEK